jgi:hypothetical protein
VIFLANPEAVRGDEEYEPSEQGRVKDRGQAFIFIGGSFLLAMMGGGRERAKITGVQ